MDEIFVAIQGYEGDYEISNLGRVRSLKRKRPIFLKQKLGGTGGGVGQRYRVSLHRDGKAHDVTVHSLVAAHFIGPRPDGLHVRHLNGDHFDNSAANLAYGTPLENHADAREHGTHPSLARRKLTDEDVRIIREGGSATELANRFGVNRSTIYNVRQEKTFNHVI